MLLGGAIGLPIPEDLPLVFSGMFLHQERVDLKILFPVVYIGIVIGDLIIYWIGRVLGPKLFSFKIINRIVTEDRARRISKKLEKHGIWVIFVARHLFYLRTATFLSCGVFQMQFLKFFICDAIAALFSSALMITFGYFISENIAFLTGITDKTNPVPLLIFVIICLLVARFYRKKKEEGLNLD